jgi:RimJ/RimL family protein N-acetyltransferase
MATPTSPDAAMEPREHQLPDERVLLIREATTEDAGALLNYLAVIGGESDFLSFGPDEFEITAEQEEDILHRYRIADNRLYIIGLVNGEVVSVLTFDGGHRPRTRHTGEFGVSVRKPYWGLGIGSAMIDALIAWARNTQTIRKVNLRVRTDNHRAVRLYLGKGFVVEGTISREMFLNGQYYVHYWMGLEL